jgi:hypothetical protein
MGKKEDAPKENVAGDHDEQLTRQAAEQTGGQQVQLRIDERDKANFYVNAFRSTNTADEVVLDVGMNRLFATPRDGKGNLPQGAPAGTLLFDVNASMVMNYYTAKRLAISLSQLVRGHEEQFGELKLNTADRVKKK